MSLYKKSPALLAGYQHGEAFCHMRYGTEDGRTWMTVWNSRDGVTPFGMKHPRTGDDITHLPPWSADVFDPFHVPDVGAYVWIDLNPERAMQLAMRNVEHWWDNEDYPARERFESKLEMAKVLVESYLFTTNPLTGERIESHTPDLVQVTEPLRDRLAIEAAEREKRSREFA